MKTCTYGANIALKPSHAIEEIVCNDLVCATLDILSSVSTAAGMRLENLDATKNKLL